MSRGMTQEANQPTAAAAAAADDDDDDDEDEDDCDAYIANMRAFNLKVLDEQNETVGTDE